MIYVSATPGPFELERASQVVEQVVRPTGLLDPPVSYTHLDVYKRQHRGWPITSMTPSLKNRIKR